MATMREVEVVLTNPDDWTEEQLTRHGLLIKELMNAISNRNSLLAQKDTELERLRSLLAQKDTELEGLRNRLAEVEEMLCVLFT